MGIVKDSKIPGKTTYLFSPFKYRYNNSKSSLIFTLTLLWKVTKTYNHENNNSNTPKKSDNIDFIAIDAI
jgi:hypothetical protein